jgi:hypothetical protein
LKSQFLLFALFASALQPLNVFGDDPGNVPPDDPECQSETESRSAGKTGDQEEVQTDRNATHCADGSEAKIWTYYDIYDVYAREERTVYTGGDNCPSPTAWEVVETQRGNYPVGSRVDYQHPGCGGSNNNGDDDDDDDDDGGGGGGDDCYKLYANSTSASGRNFCRDFYTPRVYDDETVTTLPNPDGLNILYESIYEWVPRPGFTAFNYEYPDDPEDVATYLVKTDSVTLGAINGCLDGSFQGQSVYEYKTASNEYCGTFTGFTHRIGRSGSYQEGLSGESGDGLSRWSTVRYSYGDGKYFDRKSTTTFSGQFTSAAFRQFAVAAAPDFRSVYSRATRYSGHISASLNLTRNSLYYRKVKFKFKWGENVDPEKRYPVKYLVLFTPESDGNPDNGDESEQVEVISSVSIEWNGQSGESGSFTIDPGAISATKDGTYRLLREDIDIIHPASGTLAEEKEDIVDGGYISIKREVEDEDVAPITRLALRSNYSLPSSSMYRLKFNAAGRYKIFKDAERTDEITSLQDEFPANTTTTLYLQGQSKSASRGGEEITLQIKAGNSWYDGDSVKCTVVQSEFPVVIRAFIPYLWSEPEQPASFLDVIGGILYTVIAEGDNRKALVKSDSLAVSYRSRQKVVMTPYKDLHTSFDLSSKRQVTVAELSTHHVKQLSVPILDLLDKHGDSWDSNGPSIHEEGPPSFVSSSYPKNSHVDRTISMSVIGSSEDGAMPWYIPGAVTPNIDWDVEFILDAYADPLNPKIGATGKRDKFPAYEIIVEQSDGSYEELYFFSPPYSRQPGITTLGFSENFTTSILTIE